MLCYVRGRVIKHILCYITDDMLCYITHHMSCYMTHDMLCYITDISYVI